MESRFVSHTASHVTWPKNTVRLSTKWPKHFARCKRKLCLDSSDRQLHRCAFVEPRWTIDTATWRLKCCKRTNPREGIVWSMRRKGCSSVAISRPEITHQTKLLNTPSNKVPKTLVDVSNPVGFAVWMTERLRRFTQYTSERCRGNKRGIQLCCPSCSDTRRKIMRCLCTQWLFAQSSLPPRNEPLRRPQQNKRKKGVHLSSHGSVGYTQKRGSVKAILQCSFGAEHPSEVRCAGLTYPRTQPLPKKNTPPGWYFCKRRGLWLPECKTDKMPTHSKNHIGNWTRCCFTCYKKLCESYTWLGSRYFEVLSDAWFECFSVKSNIKTHRQKHRKSRFCLNDRLWCPFLFSFGLATGQVESKLHPWPSPELGIRPGLSFADAAGGGCRVFQKLWEIEKEENERKEGRKETRANKNDVGWCSSTFLVSRTTFQHWAPNKIAFLVYFQRQVSEHLVLSTIPPTCRVRPTAWRKRSWATEHRNAWRSFELTQPEPWLCTSRVQCTGMSCRSESSGIAYHTVRWNKFEILFLLPSIHNEFSPIFGESLGLHSPDHPVYTNSGMSGIPRVKIAMCVKLTGCFVQVKDDSGDVGFALFSGYLGYYCHSRAAIWSLNRRYHKKCPLVHVKNSVHFSFANPSPCTINVFVGSEIKLKQGSSAHLHLFLKPCNSDARTWACGGKVVRFRSRKSLIKSSHNVQHVFKTQCKGRNKLG